MATPPLGQAVGQTFIAPITGVLTNATFDISIQGGDGSINALEFQILDGVCGTTLYDVTLGSVSTSTLNTGSISIPVVAGNTYTIQAFVFLNTVPDDLSGYHDMTNSYAGGTATYGPGSSACVTPMPGVDFNFSATFQPNVNQWIDLVGTNGTGSVGQLLQSNGAGQLPTWVAAPSGGGTLDAAYDFGGAGVGRTITADAGVVEIMGGGGFVINGTFGAGLAIGAPNGIPQGAGTRMFFNPNKAAFRAGQVNNTEWNNSNVGNYSVAMGFNTTASNAGSTALGYGATATGDVATAIGYYTAATGSISVAFGSLTTASGSNSAAFGSSTVASGSNSAAMGVFSTASGTASTSLGYSNEAPSFSETVIGIGATDYTPSLNGATQFLPANATDRLFVVGNAIDANASGGVDPAERSNALTILKNGNIGIGDVQPNALLHFENTLGNRKIILYESFANDHQYYGLGVNPFEFRYQVDGPAAAHVFYAGTSATTSQGLMRIEGTGNVGVGITPSVRMDVNGALALRPAIVNLTAASTTLNPSADNRSVYYITSNDIPANRTVVLANGIVFGQIVTLFGVSTTLANGFQLTEAASNINIPVAVSSLNGRDNITLMWDGADWNQTAFSNND
jgi:hypothetical protein